ncbi:MAG: BamA/TamA family outer membrane protein [Vicinamibacterales bacterium]
MRPLLLVLCCASAAYAQTSPGVVGEVRIHGNHTTPDADVLAIVGDVVGKPATDELIADMTTKLEKSGRFDGIEVRKRFRSIDNPDDVLLMVIVDEVPGVDELDLTPGAMKKFRSSGMFLPILRYDDGYGFTYGMRTSFVDRLGPRSRISVPLSWGGERQARVQVERTFKRGPVDRVAGEFGIGRKENPHYEIGDTRTSFNARVEGAVQRWFRYGVGGGVDDVEFGDVNDRLETFGADATIDTRVDPAFPRNAVHAKFGWERLQFDAGQANRNTVDARGYLGLFGGTVLALRGLSITSDQPLPAYEHNLLGGPSSLRGFDTGYKADDNLAAASAELRIPLTSPLSIGRFGVKVFADYGTAYPHGQKLGDQTFDLGMGGGVYMHLTLISIGFDVAKGRNADWRFHFGMGVTFK